MASKKGKKPTKKSIDTTKKLDKKEYTFEIPKINNNISSWLKFAPVAATLLSLYLLIKGIGMEEGFFRTLWPIIILLPILISTILLVAVSIASWKNTLAIIPLFLSALFIYYANTYGWPINEDHIIFALIASVFAIFMSLYGANILKLENSALAAVFVGALILHLVPANADYLTALDPYWHYKWMQGVYNDGYPPEFDPLTYPMFGGIKHHDNITFTSTQETSFGLTQKNTGMMTPVSYAALALALKPFGVSLYDVAMIFPALLAAFTAISIYLLVKEMFSQMSPYNKLAAFLAAFMLMLSPAFAMKAVATNSEDDALGMFLMVTGLFLFFASYQRKSLTYAILCGIDFLLLKLAWGGSMYAFMTIGIFGTIYAVVQFSHNKNVIEHIPYILIPSVIYQMSGFIAHERGGLPILNDMAPNALYPLLSAVGVSVILELIRVKWKGPILAEGSDSFHTRSVNFVEKNIMLIGVLIILMGVGFFTLYRSPTDIINWGVNALLSASEKSVVHQTVAEQNPLATSFSQFLDTGYDRYGVALLLGLGMILPLAYIGFTRASMGAIFLLTWSIPMIYGAYHKSAWAFASSTPITALGASIGLFAAMSSKDLESFRIIGTIIVLVVPIFYIPMFGTFMFEKFVGYQVMHMGPSRDRAFWEPALQWHLTKTKPGDAIVTWWDYGHWLTAVSHRPVLIDNLQADYFEIQDVARFFLNKTNEEDAMEILKPYEKAYKAYDPDWGIKYVTIDWTMIGKGSALHFIANGDIDTNKGPETQEEEAWAWKNYAQCSFLPEYSNPGQMIVNADKTWSKVSTLLFGCQNDIGIVFQIEEDKIRDITVMTPYGNKIPWSTWSQSQDVSLLGVQPFIGTIDSRVPSILMCAMNWNNLQPNSVCQLPQFRTLVYVRQEFNDFMMTRLYLGKYMDEYRELGLYNREVIPLKHFREVPDYNGDNIEDGEFTLGYVRSYEVSFEGFDN